ncbi:MAG: putative toxin-antitoxin system toxin component, PIN family [Elusimicrobia bacterium]|nr:putative toxin-antitoxin system toxin component, PIN family [Elusimicrobiota bacterium]
MKAVLDTNIIVSATLYAQSLPAYVLALGINRYYTICFSDAIMEEYRDVLSRGKFNFSATAVDRLISDIARHGVKVNPAKASSHTALDPLDQKFLDCASAAMADYLVTGNKRHFPRQTEKTAVVSPAEFAASLSEILHKNRPA